MEDSGRLKLILVGFFLAAAALGYFIFIQRKNEEQAFRSQIRPVEQIEIPTLTPTPAILGQNTNGGQASVKVVDELPKTGVPAGLIAVFSISGVIIGWSIKNFPK